MRSNLVRAIFLLTYASALCFFGCGPTDKSSKLVGTWQETSGGGKTDITFFRDHTFIASGQAANSNVNLGTGEWRIEG